MARLPSSRRLRPTDDGLHGLLQSVIARPMKMLTRQGVVVGDMGQTYLAELDADGEQARTLRPLRAAAVPALIDTTSADLGIACGRAMLRARWARR